MPRKEKKYTVTPVKICICGIPADVISVSHEHNHVFGRPLSKNIWENMREERNQSPNNHHMGGTDINLFVRRGVFIISVILMALGSAGLSLL